VASSQPATAPRPPQNRMPRMLPTIEDMAPRRT
jgi:hypothetical protein